MLIFVYDRFHDGTKFSRILSKFFVVLLNHDEFSEILRSNSYLNGICHIITRIIFTFPSFNLQIMQNERSQLQRSDYTYILILSQFRIIKSMDLSLLKCIDYTSRKLELCAGLSRCVGGRLRQKMILRRRFRRNVQH